MLPFAILIFSQSPVLSKILTFEPSCNTNKSTLDVEGELFTVIVGVIIIPSLSLFMYLYFFAEMLNVQTVNIMNTILVKNILFLSTLVLEVK